MKRFSRNLQCLTLHRQPIVYIKGYSVRRYIFHFCSWNMQLQACVSRLSGSGFKTVEEKNPPVLISTGSFTTLTSWFTYSGGGWKDGHGETNLQEQLQSLSPAFRSFILRIHNHASVLEGKSKSKPKPLFMLRFHYCDICIIKGHVTTVCDV